MDNACLQNPNHRVITAFVMLKPYTVKVVRAILRGGKGREALIYRWAKE